MRDFILHYFDCVVVVDSLFSKRCFYQKDIIKTVNLFIGNISIDRSSIINVPCWSFFYCSEELIIIDSCRIILNNFQGLKYLAWSPGHP